MQLQKQPKGYCMSIMWQIKGNDNIKHLYEYQEMLIDQFDDNRTHIKKLYKKYILTKLQKRRNLLLQLTLW